MTLILSPSNVAIETLEMLYRGSQPVQLDRAARDRVASSRDVLQTALRTDEAIYGVNTGFGKLASVRIDDDKLSVLQQNLVRSHAAGFGPALPGPIVRLILILKLISLGRGASGVRTEVVSLLEAMINADLLPVIPEKGSVGASGDLAPLAHMALTMIGEGDAVLNGTRMTAKAAFEAANIKPIRLAAKEGLALLNGTQVSTALALAGLFEARRLAEASLATCALSVDAAMGSSAPFHPGIHALRGHRGQIMAAERLRHLLDGSEILRSHVEGDERVQDPYCFRCAPQVIGACLDQLDHAARLLEIEANAATDNPLVLTDGTIVSGGNFHAEPVAFAADIIALAIAEVGAISQRRVALLVDPALSFGLPAFLAPDPGLKSGLMIAEVTSAALMSENKALANPRSVDSTPTSANQEDHVSMACHAARRLIDMNLNLSAILAVEAMAAAQGIELRAPLRTSPQLAHHIDLIRSHCPPLHSDRVVSHDIEALASWLRESNDLTAPVPSE